MIPAVLALLSSLALAAQEPRPARAPEVVFLWNGRAPGALGDAAADRPRVTIYHADPATAQRVAVVICPGGGYAHLALGHEGREIAHAWNAFGVTALVLEYRHRGGGYGHPVPLQDVRRAVRLARSRAAAWNLDPRRIGVLGFSAGGHLAASVSVHHDGGQEDAEDPIERESSRPDFAVLCYPVIAFGEAFTHRGSQRNLLGEEPDPALVRELSVEKQVRADTPPTFLWHTSEDRGVSVENALAHALALHRHGVPHELHVFEQGRHGIGLGKDLPAHRWTELCRAWLVARGVLAR